MSRTKRWLAGAASATLLLSLVTPSTSHAEDAVPAPTNHEGPCVGDTGVTVVLDYQKLGGAPEVGCFTGTPKSGIDAVKGAGFTYEGTSRWGDGFACRLNGRPAVDEVIPLTGNPTYVEMCANTPPANGYWSYWQSNDAGATWDFSPVGPLSNKPAPGEWEGWSFSLNAGASSNPAPRTGLALASYDNAESTTAAADWIAGQWDAQDEQFASGLADGILALGAAQAHPEVVTQMVEALGTTASDYIGGADSLAKVLIALDAAGQDTHNFLGCERDLAAELDDLVADNATSLNSWWGPHLVTIALNRLGKPVPQNVFDLLMARQKDDGRFGYPDDTGLALSALVGVSENTDNPQTMRETADTAIAAVIAWSADTANQQTAAGAHYWTSFSPANSTGILAGALAEAGADIASPQAFMRAQQAMTGVGAWSNSLDGTTANAMATTQGIFAVAGQGYGQSTLEVPRTTVECAAPVFTTQPASVTLATGNTATFTVEVSGKPVPSITWQVGINGKWATVDGATDTTLAFEDVTPANNGLKIRAVATNETGRTVSAEATLTVQQVSGPTPTVTVTATPSPSAPVTPTYPKTLYNTPGYHEVNGRHWFTSCEPYSTTQRCRTLIEATTVREVGGRFVSSKGWTFNNLTYLPTPESVWKGNPLAKAGTWRTADGREWETQCNTPQTGSNGCRSFIRARVVANLAEPGQPVSYGWTTRWEFNNIVQFS